MVTIAQHDISRVKGRDDLYRFLHQSLSWPVDPDDPFAYDGPTLREDIAARAQVCQIVPFSAGDPYSIFLVESDGDLRRGDLREILRRIREVIRTTGKYEGRTLDDLIFICTSHRYAEVRFVRFETRDQRIPKLSSFGWSRNDITATRTLREVNLPHLAMPAAKDGGGFVWEKAGWVHAWDVPRVTDEFYKEYKKAFELFVMALKPQVPDDSDIYAQRLCNRLLFLQFLAKKEWLNGDRRYLQTLFDHAKNDAVRPGRRVGEATNFYQDFLWPLFFNALNTKDAERPGHDEWTQISGWLGNVPFLNGGLFAPQDAYDERGVIELPNATFEPMLALFESFNFTLTESTPDDIEVAVDPEMLGKVFEELVTGRHDSGSYYTPRPIVAFMCREGLKGYLTTKSASTPEAVAAFVDEGDAAGLSDPETVFHALKEITICDPACGSGAYLLGMMQELLRLRESLFVSRHRDHAKVYLRKLEIIERNLYGVDKAQFAVNIAMLRLWLSLVVDDDRDPLKDAHVDVALPNLRFKIRAGDSLTAPSPADASLSLHGEQYADDARKLRDLHHQYFDAAHHGRGSTSKADLELKIVAMEKRIQKLFGSDAPEDAVDWRSAFAEIFAPQEPIADIGGAMNFGGTLAEPAKSGGFDVVLANPPYVRQELIKELKPLLKQVYPDVYSGTADLYCYFYARAIQTLRGGGMLAFISPNKWFKGGYGAKLREHIATSCRVASITDFGHQPVFLSATTYPMIFIAQKGNSKRAGSTIYTEVASLIPPYPDVLALQQQSGRNLPATSIHGSNWNLGDAKTSDILERMAAAGSSLGEYVDEKVYYGVKTGFNAAFVIDGITRARLIESDPRCDEIIKPLVVGRDIHKWSVEYRDTWLIVTKIGVDMSHYPTVLRHLSQWEEQLKARQDQGKDWWELRACAYYDAFDRPKIVYQEIATYQAFAYERRSAMLNNKVFMIPTNDLFLLGVLNSSTAWCYLQEKCSKLSGGALAMQTPAVMGLPIPNAGMEDRTLVATLAQKCLDANGVGCREWEKEIDERVEALYGL